MVGAVPFTQVTVIDPAALRSAARFAPMGSYWPKATGAAAMLQLVFTATRAVNDEVPIPAHAAAAPSSVARAPASAPKLEVDGQDDRVGVRVRGNVLRLGN